MEKKLVEYTLPDKTSIWVEIDDIKMGGYGTKQAAIENLEFDKALDKVKPATTLIIDKFRNLSDPPSKVEVEFGLKMNTKVGAIIASGGLEANYRILLTWESSKMGSVDK